MIFSTIRKLISQAGSEPTAAALGDALTQLDERQTNARAALAAAVENRGAALLHGDAAITKNRSAIKQAQEEIADLEAARPLVAARLENARRAEVEAHRQAAYVKGQATAKTRASLIRTKYPKLRRALLEFLRETEIDNAEIEAVNAALPAGAEPIAHPESIRDLPAQAEELVSTETIERWVAFPEWGGQPVDPQKASSFVDRGDGTATYKFRPQGSSFSVVATASKIIETVSTVLPWQPGIDAVPLSTIRLPGLRYYDPVFEVRPGLQDPQSVIEAIDNALLEAPEPERKIRKPERRSTSEHFGPSSVARFATPRTAVDQIASSGMGRVSSYMQAGR